MHRKLTNTFKYLKSLSTKEVLDLFSLTPRIELGLMTGKYCKKEVSWIWRQPFKDRVFKYCVVYFENKFSDIKAVQGVGILVEDLRLFQKLSGKVSLKRSFYFAMSKQVETVWNVLSPKDSIQHWASSYKLSVALCSWGVWGPAWSQVLLRILLLVGSTAGTKLWSSRL